MKKEQILQIINYCEFKKRIIYCKMIEYFVKLVGTVIISNGWLITELLLQEVHFTTFFYSTVAINEFRKTAHVLPDLKCLHHHRHCVDPHGIHT